MAEPPPTVYRGGLGHDFENPDIPSTLTWNMRCRTIEDYRTFITTLYNTLRVRPPGGARQREYVVTRFYDLTEAQLRDNIRVLPGFADARASPIWLFRLLVTVRHPPTNMTRAQLNMPFNKTCVIALALCKALVNLVW